MPFPEAGLDGDLAAAVAAGVLDQVRKRTLERVPITKHARLPCDYLDISGFGRPC